MRLIPLVCDEVCTAMMALIGAQESLFFLVFVGARVGIVHTLKTLKVCMCVCVNACECVAEIRCDTREQDHDQDKDSLYNFFIFRPVAELLLFVTFFGCGLQLLQVSSWSCWQFIIILLSDEKCSRVDYVGRIS